jgi:chorismate mutase
MMKKKLARPATKTSAGKQLRGLRREIASLDNAFLDVFIHYLKRRADLARQIGSVKKSASLPIRDAVIEATVEQRFVTRIGKLLDESIARRIARAILASSRRQQKSSKKTSRKRV